MVAASAAELERQLHAQQAEAAARSAARERSLTASLAQADAELAVWRGRAAEAAREAAATQTIAAEREALAEAQRAAVARQEAADCKVAVEQAKFDAAAAAAACTEAAAAREAAVLAEQQQRCARAEEAAAALVRHVEEGLATVSAELAWLQGGGGGGGGGGDGGGDGDGVPDAHSGAHGEARAAAVAEWRGSPTRSSPTRSSLLPTPPPPSRHPQPPHVAPFYHDSHAQAPGAWHGADSPVRAQWPPAGAAPPPLLAVAGLSSATASCNAPPASPSIAAVEAAAQAQASDFALRLAALQNNLSRSHETRLEAVVEQQAGYARVGAAALAAELGESERAAAEAAEALEAVTDELVGAQNETQLTNYVLAHEVSALERQLGAVRLKLALAEKRGHEAEARARRAADEHAALSSRLLAETARAEAAEVARAEAERAWLVSRTALEGALDTARSNAAGADARAQLATHAEAAHAAEAQAAMVEATSEAQRTLAARLAAADEAAAATLAEADGKHRRSRAKLQAKLAKETQRAEAAEAATHSAEGHVEIVVRQLRVELRRAEAETEAEKRRGEAGERAVAEVRGTLEAAAAALRDERAAKDEAETAAVVAEAAVAQMARDVKAGETEHQLRLSATIQELGRWQLSAREAWEEAGRESMKRQETELLEASKQSALVDLRARALLVTSSAVDKSKSPPPRSPPTSAATGSGAEALAAWATAPSTDVAATPELLAARDVLQAVEREQTAPSSTASPASIHCASAHRGEASTPGSGRRACRVLPGSSGGLRPAFSSSHGGSQATTTPGSLASYGSVATPASTAPSPGLLGSTTRRGLLGSGALAGGFSGGLDAGHGPGTPHSLGGQLSPRHQQMLASGGLPRRARLFEESAVRSVLE